MYEMVEWLPDVAKQALKLASYKVANCHGVRGARRVSSNLRGRVSGDVMDVKDLSGLSVEELAARKTIAPGTL